MARLVVLSSPSLADGFRLAGCATVVAAEATPASDAVRELAATGDVGLLLVTADLWTSLGERLRGQLERLARPVVMPIPAGVVSDGRIRAQLLGEMLQRAIGYRIELTSGSTAGGTAGSCSSRGRSPGDFGCTGERSPGMAGSRWSVPPPPWP